MLHWCQHKHKVQSLVLYASYLNLNLAFLQIPCTSFFSSGGASQIVQAVLVVYECVDAVNDQVPLSRNRTQFSAHISVPPFLSLAKESLLPTPLCHDQNGAFSLVSLRKTSLFTA